MVLNYLGFGIAALGIQLILLWCLKKTQVYQPIYNLTPEGHQAKAKTPSFGGVGIAISITIGVIVFELFSVKFLWLYGLWMAFAVIGFSDDFLSVFYHKNKGLSAKSKFFLQTGVAFVFLIIYHEAIVPLSSGMFLFYLFLIVGFSNATNLTDGLDGLLAGTSLISLYGFYAFFALLGRIGYPKLIAVVMISIFAFLLLNRHPAKIFMGDTGSLPIGAFLVGLSLILDNPWIMIVLGGLFMIETLSVIMQVMSYQSSQKRVFLMSPLHHHFELLGISERTTVFTFWIIQGLFLLVFLVNI